MTITRLLITSVILLFPLTSFACFPARISLEQRAKSAQSIYIGTVTQSTELAPAENKTGTTPSLTAGTPVIPQQLTVNISETLKGDVNLQKIQPQLLNCGSGNAKVKDKVIVFFNGQYWFTKVFSQQYYDDLKLIYPN